ncbi:MAG: sugar phosphate isomerase/epimerase family protein [Chloroflexota bacterium]
MRIGMHNWMRPEPLEVTLKRLHDLGFGGIEIMGEPRKYDVKEVRKLLDQYQIECYGSVSVMAAGHDLIHASPYIREASIQYAKECVDLSAALGGNMMTLVPSEVGKTVAMADPETEWQWAIECIREIADHAAKVHIRVGLEPINRFETNFLCRHDQALRLADDVDRENIGVTLDVFHLNIEEVDLYQAILNTGSRLVDIHIADNNRFPPGQGAFDWPKIIATLKQANYQGWLTGEFVVPTDRSPLARQEDTTGVNLSDAEMKFIRDHGSDYISDATYTEYVAATIQHLRASGA